MKPTIEHTSLSPNDLEPMSDEAIDEACLAITSLFANLTAKHGQMNAIVVLAITIARLASYQRDPNDAITSFIDILRSAHSQLKGVKYATGR